MKLLSKGQQNHATIIQQVLPINIPRPYDEFHDRMADSDFTHNSPNCIVSRPQLPRITNFKFFPIYRWCMPGPNRPGKEYVCTLPGKGTAQFFADAKVACQAFFVLATSQHCVFTNGSSSLSCKRALTITIHRRPINPYKPWQVAPSPS